MSDEENFELVRRFNQSWKADDLSVLDEFLAPDFVAHEGDDEVRGPDGWRQHVLDGRKHHGDIETGVDELIGNGGLVAERWWLRGSADGGAGIRARGVTIHRIVNGKLRENWSVHQFES